MGTTLCRRRMRFLWLALVDWHQMGIDVTRVASEKSDWTLAALFGVNQGAPPELRVRCGSEGLAEQNMNEPAHCHLCSNKPCSGRSAVQIHSLIYANRMHAPRVYSRKKPNQASISLLSSMIDHNQQSKTYTFASTMASKSLSLGHHNRVVVYRREPYVAVGILPLLDSRIFRPVGSSSLLFFFLGVVHEWRSWGVWCRW